MKKFNLIKVIKQTAGFTMIELLIVIAILGILATAVLSAINPIEQINRGRDTGTRSDAEQLLSAIDRYNAFTGYFPWQTGATDTGWPVVWSQFLPTSVEMLDDNGCWIGEKISSEPSANATCTSWADELKITFITRVTDSDYNFLNLYHGLNMSDSTYVCFAPKSKAFATEALNRLDTNEDGLIDGGDTIPDDYPVDAYNNPAVGQVINCGPEGNCICLP